MLGEDVGFVQPFLMLVHTYVLKHRMFFLCLCLFLYRFLCLFISRSLCKYLYGKKPKGCRFGAGFPDGGTDLHTQAPHVRGQERRQEGNQVGRHFHLA